MKKTTRTVGAFIKTVAFAAEKHRNQRQIEHAPHLSPETKLVALTDKICNLRDMHALHLQTGQHKSLPAYVAYIRSSKRYLMNYFPAMLNLVDSKKSILLAEILEMTSRKIFFAAIKKHP